MFKPLTMSKIYLYVLNEDLEKVTSILYDLKSVEFVQINNEGVGKYEHNTLAEDSNELLKLRSTITALKPYFSKDDGKLENKAIEKTQTLKEQERKLKKEILHLKDELKRQKILVHLKVTEKELESKKTIIGFIPESSVSYLKQLKKHKIGHRKYKLGERLYFAAKAKELPFAYKEFYLPKKVSFNIVRKLSESETKLQTVYEKLEKLANSSFTHLLKEELKLSKEISLLEAKSSFGKTTNITILGGYSPSNKVRVLERKLETEIGDRFEIEVEEAKDEAPIQLNHGAVSGKFEALLKMYSLPKYGEFDPTTLIFLVFPLFYGFVLGDVGYGFISLILFTIARYKKPQIKDFLSILQLSSISSMIFGALYGEYFGFEPYHLFSRIHNSNELLAIAVGFGFLHLNLGLLIGMYNERKNFKKVLYDKLSWIILQIGLGLLAYGSYVGDSSLSTIGTVVSVIAGVLMYLGHGLMGLIELPSFFTNALSYARLMAVGISSVVIALLVNKYSMGFMESGIFGMIGGIVLFTVGHIFNIALGNFESFLHTLRLHYVEFFTKFYSGGGKEFKPFGKKHLHDFEKEEPSY